MMTMPDRSYTQWIRKTSVLSITGNWVPDAPDSGTWFFCCLFGQTKNLDSFKPSEYIRKPGFSGHVCFIFQKRPRNWEAPIWAPLQFALANDMQQKKGGVLQAVLSINPGRLSGLFFQFPSCGFGLQSVANQRRSWKFTLAWLRQTFRRDFLAAKIAFCRPRFVLAACRCSAHEATLQAKFNRKPHSIVFLGEWTSLNYLKFYT